MIEGVRLHGLGYSLRRTTSSEFANSVDLGSASMIGVLLHGIVLSSSQNKASSVWHGVRHP